ncbi:hypothetical protein GCM10020000_17290 [Streptomyces olivoverticillatus]
MWPPAEPSGLDGLVPDTVLDGARYGAMTLRAVSLRGDSARYRGEPRRDALLTARFGDGDDALLLVAMASGARAAEGSHRAARDVCEWIGGAVGRSHARLAEDLRSGRRDELKSGLHRLTDRAYGRLRARAAKLGRQPSEHTAALRCLLLPADDRCRTRVFFGVGGGGLFRLRDGAWQDLDPERHEAEPAGEPVVGYGSGDRFTVDLGIPTPPAPRPSSTRRRCPASPSASGRRSPGPATRCCCAARAWPNPCAGSRSWGSGSPSAGRSPSRRGWPSSSPTPSCGSRVTPTTAPPAPSGRPSRSEPVALSHIRPVTLSFG